MTDETLPTFNAETLLADKPNSVAYLKSLALGARPVYGQKHNAPTIRTTLRNGQTIDTVQVLLDETVPLSTLFAALAVIGLGVRNDDRANLVITHSFHAEPQTAADIERSKS